MDSDLNTDGLRDVTTPQPAIPKRSSAALSFIGGLLIGAILTYGLLGLNTAERMSAAVAPVMDANVVREMAREGARKGVEDALAAESTRTAQELGQSDSDPTTPVGTVGGIGPQRPTPNSSSARQLYPIRANNLQGSETAPITIIEYGDFGCVFCSRFHKDTFQQVIDNYVKTGKARFMFKQMPITQLHPGADIAAVGSECAADQGQFWPYHDLVFSQAQASFTAEQVQSYATQLKLDMKKFEDCMAKQDGAAAQRVQLDMAEAGEVGVRGTPTFLINGRLLVGAQPYSVFQRTLDAALGQPQ